MIKTKKYEAILTNGLHMKGSILQKSEAGIMFGEVSPEIDCVLLGWDEIRMIIPLN